MSSPYDPPSQSPSSEVTGPALALMGIAGLWLGILTLSLATSALLLLSGARGLESPYPEVMTKQTQILIRMGFSSVTFAFNAYVFMGANEMRTSGNLQMARNACMLASIPGLSPCYLIGIPIGLWGSGVLGRPEVARGFSS